MTPTLRAQDRRALIIGAVALAVLFGWAKVLRPAMTSLRADDEMLVAQRALLWRERVLVATAPQLPRARDAARRSLGSARARLFDGDSVAATASLAAYLSDVAAATGVRLTTVDGRPPVTTNGVTRLLADLRGEGSWRQTLAFVRTLESAGQLVDIADLRIERGPRGGPLGGDLVTIVATVAGYAVAGGAP